MSLRLLFLTPSVEAVDPRSLRLPSGADVLVLPAASTQVEHRLSADVAVVDLGSDRPRDEAWPQVIRHLSDSYDYPVVVLGPGEPDVQEAALLAGAVGFVERTLAEQLLGYQLSNLVQRFGGQSRARRIVAGDLTIDPDSFTARAAGAELSLSSLEFALLSRLAERSSRVCARAELAALGPHRRSLTQRSLENHIWRLRRKLGDAGSRCKIETAIGLGYKLTV